MTQLDLSFITNEIVKIKNRIKALESRESPLRSTYSVTLISGENIEKGSILMPSTTEDDTVVVAAAGSNKIIGIAGHDVVAGEKIAVIVAGNAMVKLGLGVSASRGNFIFMSSTESGAANSSNSKQSNQIGISTQTVSAGSLVKCVLNFS